jgi:aldose 1-epimerase
MNGRSPVLFGIMPDGTKVEAVTLRAAALSCTVLTYGGVIQSLRVPDRTGLPVDIVLGFDRLEDYLRQDKFMGAIIGRYANRIKNSRFSLNGKEYLLRANDGLNHLHGGPSGFDKRVWKLERLSENSVTLFLTSPDGEENYPGTLEVWVTYTLMPEGLEVEYQARSDQDTLCNLTNHSYFNLSGHDSGPIMDQYIQLFADFYTPTDKTSIPVGGLASVEGTPMDLRTLTRFEDHIDDDFDQLQLADGYDQNWAVNGWDGTLRPAARAMSLHTGITLEVLTTLPGIQLYSGNYLNGSPAGKGCAPYAKRWGFCLETQFFPNSPNEPQFPSPILKQGTFYRQKTCYHFL